ncbi:hypothetical protein ES703_83883 [subsurface metagenome]
MIGIKARNPKIKSIKGTEQTKSQDRFLLILKSYQKVFFKESPITKKELMVAKKPNKAPGKIIFLPNKLVNP